MSSQHSLLETPSRIWKQIRAFGKKDIFPHLDLEPPDPLENTKDEVLEEVAKTIRASSLFLATLSISAFLIAGLPDAALLDQNRNANVPGLGLSLPVWASIQLLALLMTATMIFQNLHLAKFRRWQKTGERTGSVPYLLAFKGPVAVLLRWVLFFGLPLYAALELAIKVAPIPRGEVEVVFLCLGAMVLSLVGYCLSQTVKKRTRRWSMFLLSAMLLTFPEIHYVYENRLVEYQFERRHILDLRDFDTWFEYFVPEFRHLDLDRANFASDPSAAGADLRNLPAVGASIHSADLTNVTLDGSNFSGARVKKSIFDHASIAWGDDVSPLSEEEGGRRPKMADTKIMDTSLKGVRIDGLDISKSYMWRATFDGSRWSDTYVTDTEIHASSFDGASFGSTLDGDTWIIGSSLHGGVHMIGADLAFLHLRDREGGNPTSVVGVNFSQVHWQGQINVPKLCAKLKEGAGWQLTVRDPSLSCGAKILPEHDAPGDIDLKGVVIDTENLYYWVGDDKLYGSIEGLFSCDNITQFKNWWLAKGNQMDRCWAKFHNIDVK